MLKVLLADGHPLTLNGVQEFLKCEPNFEIIGIASTRQAALEMIVAHHPEVMVLDDNLPDMAATHLLATIHQQSWLVRVLIFSAGGTAKTVRTLLEAGTRGYLLKTSPAQELSFAVRSIARGHQWFSQEIWALLASEKIAKIQNREEEEEEKEKLTPRQREILRRVALGHTDAQIALELGVTTKGINKQLCGILARLNAPNRTNAVYQATKQRWI
jgi:DNA-binding NarL/FixJ family response regulator